MHFVHGAMPDAHGAYAPSVKRDVLHSHTMGAALVHLAIRIMVMVFNCFQIVFMAFQQFRNRVQSLLGFRLLWNASWLAIGPTVGQCQKSPNNRKSIHYN